MYTKLTYCTYSALFALVNKEIRDLVPKKCTMKAFFAACLKESEFNLNPDVYPCLQRRLNYDVRLLGHNL